MKQKHKLLTILMLALASTLVIFTACEDEDDDPEPTNSAPTCTITSPVDGAEFTQGETITIAAEAEDEDNNLEEVRFYVNDVGIGSATSFPYNFDWDTSEEEPGLFTIKAEAIDEAQEKTSDEITITLAPSGSAPVAAFIVNQTNITEGESISFTDQSTNNPTSWSWNFGDGNTSTEPSTSHTYNSAGSYTVELTVTNDYGSDTETKTDYITVSSSVNWGDGVTDIDGNNYQSVIIGNQEWMAENLKTTRYNNGTQIELAIDGEDWYNGDIGKYCYYENEESNVNTYGVLYNWYAVETQQLCPDNWHIPSEDEWRQLIDYSINDGYEDSVGYALKDSLSWINYNAGGADVYGFRALAAGVRGTGTMGTTYTGLGQSTGFWSSNEWADFPTWAFYFFVSEQNTNADVGTSVKKRGRSIRCIKD